MRKLVICVSAAATALVFLDYVAIGNTANSTAIPQFTDSQGAAVNRTAKGDRQDRGGASVQLKIGAPHPVPTRVQRETPQPVQQESKMPEGCELAVSPLAESARSAIPALCLS
jgi:hypothetical protein